MCGIAGFVGAGSEADLVLMQKALLHRGPDSQGSLLHSNVGLVHTRLAVIDLSESGRQPMLSDDESVAIIFNGEIYNFKALRDTHLHDVKFKGGSDTEVIIRLYERFGKKCFSLLSGMFAIALYDFKLKTLFLARDAMGEKPLYFAETPTGVVFGSELTAVLSHSSVRREVSVEALRAYFTYNAVPHQMSMVRGVKKIGPGELVTLNSGTVLHERCAGLPHDGFAGDMGDAVHALDGHLRRSVESQMVSDVPLGVLLSGGLDSSTIAYYAQQVSKQKIKTFSIGFEEKTYDESAAARSVATLLGTDHHELVLSGSHMFNEVPNILNTLDEPLADQSYIPSTLLARLVRGEVTVALGGDGADELFAGYPTFLADKFLSWYQRVPESVRNSLIEPLVEALPVTEGYMSFDLKVKRFVRAASLNRVAAHQAWMEAFSTKEQNLLFSQSQQHSSYNPYQQSVESFSEFSGEVGNKLLWVYARRYLCDQVLTKTDRSSMVYALELRAPFLDKDLVSFAFSLPYNYKWKGFRGKYVLRTLMDGKLPSSVVWGKKHGFAVPLQRWLKNELRPYMEDLLSADTLNRHKLFNSEYVARIIKEHCDGRANHTAKLWSLMAFQAWHRRVVQGSLR